MAPIPEEPKFDPIVQSKAEADAEQRAHRKALRDISSRWGDQHQKRVAEVVQELDTNSPDAGAHERLIHRLAATSTVASEMLGRAQLQLAERLERLVDDPQALLIVARSLREVTTTQTATMRSIQELVSAAGTLRAQRRLVEHHARQGWHEDVGGASFRHARRDPSARAPASN